MGGCAFVWWWWWWSMTTCRGRVECVCVCVLGYGQCQCQWWQGQGQRQREGRADPGPCGSGALGMRPVVVLWPRLELHKAQHLPSTRKQPAPSGWEAVDEQPCSCCSPCLLQSRWWARGWPVAGSPGAGWQRCSSRGWSSCLWLAAAGRQGQDAVVNERSAGRWLLQAQH